MRAATFYDCLSRAAADYQDNDTGKLFSLAKESLNIIK